jgi:glycosyltransferase involved in cell wall biosynthesis
VHFLIVGECRQGGGIPDGYTEGELRELIAVDPRIHYAGYRNDMPDIYQSSDIVVAPSRWEEPFGLVLIEAGAARRPVVATRVGGISEVVIDAETGLLVEAGNIHQLTDAVQSLVDKPERNTRLGYTAYRRVEENCH